MADLTGTIKLVYGGVVAVADDDPLRHLRDVAATQRRAPCGQCIWGN
jgi:hypothetical protein